MDTTNILITGRPGVGKTTLVLSVCRMLERHRPAGFLTREIREGGSRQGFELVSLDGRRRTLAHKGMAGQGKVGKYGVDVQGFEAYLDALRLEAPEAGFIAIDEIGKMECLSDTFVAMTRQALDSERPLLATIAAKSGGFITEVKARNDVELVSMAELSRDALAGEITERLRALLC
jgi:nucleoside-triphosphatase